MKCDNLVDISSLYFERGRRAIFKGLNIKVKRGKVTAIMGPSGTGKTTLLRLISAELHPSKGSVIVDGDDIHALNRNALFDARRKIGMLFQSGALFTDMSVYDNVAFPIREHTALSEAMIRNIVVMKLEAVGLRGAGHLMPSELSGGMARRVALARAIALDPQLMLYDEPFTGQDPISLGMLVSLIKNLNTLLGLTSVIVSHDVEETLSIADYIYLIAEGKVVGEGTASDLKASNEAHVKQFLNGLADGVVPFHYPTVNNYTKDLLDA